MEKNTSNRRKYSRIDNPHLLKFRKFELNGDSGSDRIEAVVRNFSAGGVAFESERFFESGTILEIELRAPGWEKFKNEFYKDGTTSLSKSLVVLGQVVRTRVIAEGFYDIAVLFVGIDEKHQAALAKYIDIKEQK